MGDSEKEPATMRDATKIYAFAWICTHVFAWICMFAQISRRILEETQHHQAIHNRRQANPWAIPKEPSTIDLEDEQTQVITEQTVR